MARFDRIDAYMATLAMKEKLLEGDALMDNQDVCRMLNISKRTLQRYRSSGALPYRTLYSKVFYKRSDVEAFMIATFGNDETAAETTGDDSDDSDD